MIPEKMLEMLIIADLLDNDVLCDADSNALDKRYIELKDEFLKQYTIPKIPIP